MGAFVEDALSFEEMNNDAFVKDVASRLIERMIAAFD